MVAWKEEKMKRGKKKIHTFTVLKTEKNNSYKTDLMKGAQHQNGREREANVEKMLSLVKRSLCSRIIAYAINILHFVAAATATALENSSQVNYGLYTISRSFH